MVLLWNALVTLRFCWAIREFTLVWIEIILKSFQIWGRHLAGHQPFRPGLEKHEGRQDFFELGVWEKERTSSTGTARRAKDSSPVRQHWEKDGPAVAPGRGGRTHGAVLLAPHSGACKRRSPATHGGAPWATLFRPPGSPRRPVCGFPLCR